MTTKKNIRRLVLAGILQVVFIYVFKHFFIEDVCNNLQMLETSLYESGMTEPQVNAVSRSIGLLGTHVSSFVLLVGLTFAIINTAVLTYITRND